MKWVITFAHLMFTTILGAQNDIELIEKNISKYMNCPINIIMNSKRLDDIGYNNCDMLKNGESLIIETFIRQGDIVFDVGAHTGEWTESVLNAVKYNCIIYAFEPVSNFYEKLKQVRAKYPNIFTFNLGLGKEEEMVEMNCFFQGPPGLPGCSSLFYRPILHKFLSKKVKVKIICLDKFVEEEKISHINFLKIDTEGSEWNVLAGAREFIKRNCIDVIQFEYGGTYPDAGVTLFQVYNYLKSSHYYVFRILSNSLVYIPNWDDALENYQYSNYLAVKNK